MLIADPVYGSETIDSLLLRELINTPEMQRQKALRQGATWHYLDGKDFTRYDHAVGVLLLLKRFGASMTEQINGLLHDISHTAFGHVFDYVYPNDEHDFHERCFEKMLMGSSIPKILVKYGHSLDEVLNAKEGLLDRPLPGLCADRIDYTLRNFAVRYTVHHHAIYLRHLMTIENQFCFSEPNIALQFGKDFLSLDRDVMANPLGVASYNLLAEAIQMGMNSGILQEEDIFTTDDALHKKLMASGNANIIAKVKAVNPALRVILTTEEADYPYKPKLRYVDPDVYVDGTRVKVSDLFPEYKTLLEQKKENHAQQKYIRIISA